MQCHGRHADGSKCENFAEPNGFCKLHQEQASMEIIQNLSIIQQELKALQQLKVVDPNHISRIQGEIQDLKKRQRKYGLECFQSEDCRSKMQSLAIDLETLLSPDGQDLNLPKIVLENMDQVSATERLTNATQDLAYLSQTSTIDPTMAKWEVSKSQEARNAEKILDLQTTIDAIGAESEEKQRSTRNEINQLQNRLQDTISEKQQITSIEEQLQQQLANSQAQSVNVTEQYSLHTANLQDELLKYKSMYETLQAREMRLNVSLKQFEESEVQLNNQVRDLKDSYEQKLKNLQDDYANKVQQGATILSEREQQLMQDIAHLQKALKTNF